MLTLFISVSGICRFWSTKNLLNPLLQEPLTPTTISTPLTLSKPARMYFVKNLLHLTPPSWALSWLRRKNMMCFSWKLFGRGFILWASRWKRLRNQAFLENPSSYTRTCLETLILKVSLQLEQQVISWIDARYTTNSQDSGSYVGRRGTSRSVSLRSL